MDLQTRSVEIRSVDADKREVRGIAVPFEEEIEIWGDYEKVAPGAVIPNPAGVKLFWEHSKPIGKITECADTETGCEITAVISRTTLGDEAYELVKDGVINRFSIGFIPQKWEEEQDKNGDYHRRYTEIDLREVSLVAFPAYKSAEVTSVRHNNHPQHQQNRNESMNKEEIIKQVTEALEPKLTEFRTELTDQWRSLMVKQADEPSAPARETRSVGELLKRAIKGDTEAAKFMTRYDGGKLEDDARAATPVWVEDLTRLYLAPSPIAALFDSKPLPSEGMQIEFTRVKSNTMTVAERPRAKEGQKVDTGSIKTETFTKELKEYAGGFTLSRLEIERSTVDMLNLSMRALAVAAGKCRNDYYSKAFEEGLKENASNALTIPGAASTWTAKSVRHLLIDAAEKMQDTGHISDVMVVNKEVFKVLTDFEDGNGRPLMITQGDGVNSIGNVSIKSPQGQIFNFTILPNFKQSKIGETNIIGGLLTPYAFEKRESPIVSLQGTTVLNLTEDFAVYGYGAAGLVQPDALIPIKHG